MMNSSSYLQVEQIHYTMDFLAKQTENDSWAFNKTNTARYFKTVRCLFIIPVS